MRPLGDDLVVAPTDTLYQAFTKASTNGTGRLLVLDRGALAGSLSLSDLTDVLALRTTPAGVSSRPTDRRAA